MFHLGEWDSNRKPRKYIAMPIKKGIIIMDMSSFKIVQSFGSEK
jgi:hypothetical protein